MLTVSRHRTTASSAVREAQSPDEDESMWRPQRQRGWVKWTATGGVVLIIVLMVGSRPSDSPYESFLRTHVPEFLAVSPVPYDDIQINRCTIRDSETFFRQFVAKSKPVLIRHCKIPNLRWLAHSSEILKRMNDPEVEVEVRPRGDFNFVFWSTEVEVQKMNFSRFLSMYSDPARKSEYYMTQLRVPVGVPHFSGDAIKQGDESTAKYLWMGRGGEVSAAHYDYYDNLYTVVKGKKQLILIPPTSTRYIYATQRGSGEPGVDTIQSKVDFKRPDTKRYPLFEKAQVFSVNVLPGDILYIPSFWWHRVEAIGQTSAVSFWIQEVHSPVQGSTPTPYLALFDRLQVALDAHARSLATGPPTPSHPSADEAVPSENSRMDTPMSEADSTEDDADPSVPGSSER